MNRVTAYVLSLVSFLAFSFESAHANTDEERVDWDTHSSVALQLGVGTSYGFAGVEYEYSPVRWLAIAAGIGQGADDQQLASAIRLRKVVNGNAAIGFSIGPGYGDSSTSDGPLLKLPHSGSTVVEYNNAIWLNAEAYIEIRYPSGLFVRGFGGFSQSLLWDTPGKESQGSALIRPSFGGAIGHSF